jgi:membrane associated rhomboid family serine protease
MPIQLTRTIKVLLIANFAAFVIQQSADRFFGAELARIFALTPSLFVNQYYLWQIVTYSFLHGDVLHLMLNLLMLAFIGGELDLLWGSGRFLRYYFFCVAVAGLVYLLFQLLVSGGLNTPMVGASGGIYGLLMAYGLIFGERTLLFMLLFPMKAKHFIWVLALIEFMTSVFSPHGGLGSVAHLAGMGAGFSLLWFRAALRTRGKGSKKKPRGGKKTKSGHLKLVVNRPGEFDDDADNNPKTWH